MGTPIPPVALKDQCTITYNNTLYVYSPDALQSLPLEPNAQWNQEPMGVSLTGATCLLGGVDGDNSKPALYVVGGSTNSTSVQYSGLQRYSIQDKTWQSITPLVTVTENRQHHGAAYMLDTSTILVYGGSQNGGSDPSTQTFLMETYPPYDVRSFQSQAPPVVDPIMLPWDDGHVGMVGGSSTNVGVWRFGVDEGWTNVGVTLPNPLPNYTVAQCALLTLDDQSKILETFDLSQSPNVVTSNVLLQPGGSPAPFGETVGGSTTTTTTAPASSISLASRKRKRDVVLSNFPTYNSTFAPTTTRSGFSLSQGSNGLIVIAGGSSSGQVAIFNQTANGWLDASQLLNPQGKPQTLVAGPSSTTSFTTTPTSSHTAGASPVQPSKHHPLTLLGVVLGAICGFAAILIMLLLLLRYLKRSRNLKMQRQRDGHPGEKRRGHGRSDTEDIPLSRNGQPMGKSPVPPTIQQGVDPIPSAGRVDFKMSHGRTLSSASNKLKLDPIQSSHISFGPAMFSKPREKSPLTISRPILQDPTPEIQAQPKMDNSQASTEPSQSSGTVDLAKSIGTSHRKTDEGWSTYFQGNNVVNLTGDRPSFMSTNSRPGSSSSRNSKRGSYWPDPGLAAPAAPVAVAINTPFKSTPSNLRDSSGHMLAASSVPMGSPKLEHSSYYRNNTGLVVSDGVHGKISSASSTTDDNDDYEPVEYDTTGGAYSSGIPEGGPYSSGIPESVHELPAWTPVGNTWSGPVQRQFRSRGSSTSDFNSSVLNPPYATAVSNEPNIHGFPMPNPTTRQVGPQLAGLPQAQPHIQHPTAAHFTATIPNQPAAPPPTRPGRPEENRDYFGPNFSRMHENTNTDVSWLNLGTTPVATTPAEMPGSIPPHERPR
jgi:hypothetical protein